MAYCGKCGTHLSDGAKFCPKCGNPCGDESCQLAITKVEKQKNSSKVSTIAFLRLNDDISISYLSQLLKYQYKS